METPQNTADIHEEALKEAVYALVFEENWTPDEVRACVGETIEEALNDLTEVDKDEQEIDSE